MSHEEVCTWLRLLPGSWPPDHYTLLGLTPGEADVERIEQRAHDRMLELRSHQLQHPEQVTEAMNLLARAFACLTDPRAKRDYDAVLFGKTEAPPPAGEPEVSPPPADPLAWLFGPWSQRAPAELPAAPLPPLERDWTVAPPPPRLPADTPPPMPAAETNGVSASATPVELPASPPPAVEPKDPVTSVAHSSPARRGLGTKRALYQRLARTREMLRVWEAAGKYLEDPERKLTRTAEAAELIRQLHAIRRLLAQFPPLLGEAGQPGFYVVTLANQPRQMVSATFRMLLDSQRERLARDWQDGCKLLSAHRQFLRQELKALRKTSLWGRAVRVLDTLVRDHSGLVLLAVAVAAIAVTIWLLLIG